jgi:hypothetical protein
MLKMAKRKTSNLVKLPKLGAGLRRVLIRGITFGEDYRKNLAKGIRLFTSEELEELESRFKDGLTWEDIERELSQKGIFLKKATFRKYVQDGHLPTSSSYRKTDKGRVALFPANMISCINFVLYFHRVASGGAIDNLLSLLKDYQITYFEAVEQRLTFSDYLRPAIYRDVMDDDGEAHDAISEGLSSHPEERKKSLDMLEEIRHAYESKVRPKINELIAYLAEHSMKASGELAAFLDGDWITYLQAVESCLTLEEKLRSSIHLYIGWDDGGAHDAISKGLATEPSAQKWALDRLYEIDRVFESEVDAKTGRLISFLKENSMSQLDVSTGEKEDVQNETD